MTVRRYSPGPLPPYAYVPGRSPHPRRDPRGHGFGRPEPRPTRVDPASWASCEVYLRGADLYNLGYWWESHEAFEALWRGHQGEPTAYFFQGLIQIAAAELKRVLGSEGAAQALYRRGLDRLLGAGSPFLGLDVTRFAREVEARRAGVRDRPAQIDLALPAMEGLSAGRPP